MLDARIREFELRQPGVSGMVVVEVNKELCCEWINSTFMRYPIQTPSTVKKMEDREYPWEIIPSQRKLAAARV